MSAKTFLPIPEEPLALKATIRHLLTCEPSAIQELLISNELWPLWQEHLESVGFDKARFMHVIIGYRYELQLWLAGERIWEHCAAGLRGRIARRV